MLYTKHREQIVKEAKEWAGTPYRMCSRMKHFGCDCLGFIAGVFINTGYISAKDADAAIPKSYSVQIGQHQETTEYIDGIRKFMREIPEHEAKPGDVVMYKLSLAYTHSAVIVSWPTYVMHAMAHGGVRGSSGIDNPHLKGKPRKFFTLLDEYTTGV